MRVVFIFPGNLISLMMKILSVKILEIMQQMRDS